MIVEPWKAEQWQKQMDRTFKTFEYTNLKKKWLTTFYLTYGAANWWEVMRATIKEEGVRRMNWTAFKNKFQIGRASCRERVFRAV